MAQIKSLKVNGTSYNLAANELSTFSGTSEDAMNPTAYTHVLLLGGNETLGSIFTKISNMFKNIRWIYNYIGSTDISSIGNGTISGAISTINQSSGFSGDYNDLINKPTILTESDVNNLIDEALADLVNGDNIAYGGV